MTYTPYTGEGIDIDVLATNDLSNNQYCAVALDSNGQAVLPAAGALCIGILQNKPRAGESALIRVLGTTRCNAGGTITAGTIITTDSSGRIVTGGAGKVPLGLALGANVLGDVATIFVNPAYVVQ